MTFLVFLLGCRLFSRRPFFSLTIAQDVFIAWQAAWLPLVLIGELYTLADLFLSRRLKTRLHPDHFRYLRQAGSFWDSAHDFGIWNWIGIALLVTTLTVFIGTWSLPWYIGLSAGIISIIKLSPENALFRLELYFFWPRKYLKYEPVPIPSFLIPPAENCRYLSPHFPLLKYTTGFFGPKLFEIPHPERLHVVFLFLESFRAHDVNERTTPFFETLKKEGVYFSEFYSNGVLTHQAVISSLFGIYPFFGSIRERAIYDEPRQKTDFRDLEMIGIADILKNAGYRTAYIDASLSLDIEKAFYRKNGFEVVEGRNDFAHERYTSWGVYDQDLMRHLASFLGKGEAPLFTVGFTVSNHHPWQTPEGYDLDSYGDVEDLVYQKFLRTMRYSDHCLKLFFEAIEKSKTRDRLLIFIMGDHGQGMGEHGLDKLQNSVYEENIHIPLLILAPGLKSQEIKTPASQVDLVPTLLDILNLKAVNHAMGRSLMREGSMPLFFNNSHIGFSLGCREDRYKYVLTDLLEKKEEFFDLAADREEKNPLTEAPIDREKVNNCYKWMFSLYEQGNIAFTQRQIADYSDHPDLTDAELLSSMEQRLSPSLLNLSGCLRITDSGLKAIAPYCRHLRFLNLSQCLITEKGVEAIRSKAPHLEHIDLTDCLLLNPTG